MLRIAIVSNYFAPHIGGVETQNRLIGEALVQRGHDVTVLTRRYDPALPGREIRNGVKIERLRPSGQGMIAKWFMNASTFRRIALGRRPFDVVLANQFSAHVFGPALASVWRHVPLVIRTVETGEFSGEISVESLNRIPVGLRAVVRAALGAARAWAYRRAHLVVAISTALAREAEAFGVHPESIVLIPCAVDTDRFRPVPQFEKIELRASLGLDPEARIVTYVGRLARGKGLLTLVEAWADVARDDPRALLLIVGGSPGSDSSHDAESLLRAAIAAGDLHQRVHLTGAVNHVERYLQASDLFVFPSEQEGFGNALVEAMSCGLPVICAQAEGAATDFVVDGVHGLKFEVNDSAALRVCLGEFLSDKSLRKRMGAASRATVEGHLTVDRIVTAYEQAFLAVSREQRSVAMCAENERRHSCI